MFRYLILGLIACSACAEDLSTLIEQSDVIVIGKGVSAGHGNPHELYSILKAKEFEALVPFYAYSVACVRVREVLKGQATNEYLKFYRLSDIMLRTQNIENNIPTLFRMDGIWLLNKIPDSQALYATSSDAFQSQSLLPDVKQLLEGSVAARVKLSSQKKASTPDELVAETTNTINIVKQLGLRSIPLLRNRLSTATATEKKEIIDIIKRYGLIPMIPDLIGLISDREGIPRESDVVYGCVGDYACYTLGQLAYKLDRIEIKERGRENFTLIGARYTQENFGSVAKKVAINWESWWKSYQQYGPKSSQP